jgi:hypothetical protein
MGAAGGEFADEPMHWYRPIPTCNGPAPLSRGLVDEHEAMPTASFAARPRAMEAGSSLRHTRQALAETASAPNPRERPDEVAGVAVRNALQVVLVLRLGLPERACRRDFGDDLAGPEARGVDVGDGVFRHALLLVARVEDGRAVAQPTSLPWRLRVLGSWIWKKNSSSLR